MKVITVRDTPPYGRYQVISIPNYIVKSALTQIGTCHGQFGTSVKNNL